LGVPTPERFIFTQFAAMPLWVRVITYLLFVLVVVHGYLVPRTVSGTVDVLSKQGVTYTSYANSLVSVLGDRSTRYFTNGHEDGTWSIPVPSQLPAGFELEFAEKDNPQGREKLQICATDMLLGHSIEVRYHPDGVGAKFTRTDSGCRPAKLPGGADDSVGSVPSISLIRTAYAQAPPAMKIRSPQEVSQAIATAVKESRPAGVGQNHADSHTAVAAAAALNVQLTSAEAAGVRSNDQLSQLLQQKVYSKQIGTDPTAVFLYAGQINDVGNWANPPNIKLDGADAARPFRAGDVVTTQTHVNKRADYIRLTFFGWQNADSLGVANVGDQFLVEESKLIGSNLWIKAIPVKVEQ